MSADQIVHQLRDPTIACQISILTMLNGINRQAVENQMTKFLFQSQRIVVSWFHMSNLMVLLMTTVQQEMWLLHAQNRYPIKWTTSLSTQWFTTRLLLGQILQQMKLNQVTYNPRLQHPHQN